MTTDPLLLGLNLFHGQLINGKPFNMEVTLLVGGWLVSGIVVSYDEYLKSNVVLDVCGKEAFEIIASKTSDESDVKVFNSPSDFIHLKGVKLFSGAGAGIPSNSEGIFMRIRRDSVSGFIVGTLQQAPQS